MPSKEALDSFNRIENLHISDEAMARLHSLVPVEDGVERMYTDAEEAIVLLLHAAIIVDRLLFSGIKHRCHGDNLKPVISLISILTSETNGTAHPS